MTGEEEEDVSPFTPSLSEELLSSAHSSTAPLLSPNCLPLSRRCSSKNLFSVRPLGLEYHQRWRVKILVYGFRCLLKSSYGLAGLVPKFAFGLEGLVPQVCL